MKELKDFLKQKEQECYELIASTSEWLRKWQDDKEEFLLHWLGDDKDAEVKEKGFDKAVSDLLKDVMMMNLKAKAELKVIDGIENGKIHLEDHHPMLRVFYYEDLVNQKALEMAKAEVE